jgi:hypothetical protein
MAGEVKELGQYKRMAASGNVVLAGGTLLEFICTTSGTLQLTEGIIAGGADIVSQIPVTAGVVYPFGIRCPLGVWAVLGGGAIGTFVG